MKVGDRVIQIHTGNKGYVVTKSIKVFDDIQIGIKFDDEELNKIFNPYYCSIDTLELWYD